MKAQLAKAASILRKVALSFLGKYGNGNLLENMIFICYRRDDSSGYAGRIYDALRNRLGPQRLFRDVDAIGPGDNFPRVISETIAASAFFIVIIGRNWLHSTNGGTRRLENPHDFVRKEISAALSLKIDVIPVLVQGAMMPDAEDLPDELMPLANIQALEISDSRWEYDINRLIQILCHDLADTDRSSGPDNNRPDKRTGNLARKLIAITIIFTSFIYFFFRADVIRRLLFTGGNTPVQELFFPTFLLIIGLFIFNYKIK